MPATNPYPYPTAAVEYDPANTNTNTNPNPLLYPKEYYYPVSTKQPTPFPTHTKRKLCCVVFDCCARSCVCVCVYYVPYVYLKCINREYKHD